MSRFYADITGGRGTATRQGHAASGIRGHVRGWNSGVRVDGRTMQDGADSIDRFDIYATGGSTADCYETFIGTVYRCNNEPVRFELADECAEILRTVRMVL